MIYVLSIISTLAALFERISGSRTSPPSTTVNFLSPHAARVKGAPLLEIGRASQSKPCEVKPPHLVGEQLPNPPRKTAAYHKLLQGWSFERGAEPGINT